MGALTATPNDKPCREVLDVDIVTCAECGQWWSTREKRPACPLMQVGKPTKRRPIDGDRYGERSRTGHVCADCGILMGSAGDGKPRRCAACRIVGFQPYTPEQVRAMNGPLTREK